MFRDKYETANHSIAPKEKLVSDTKQKMYEKMIELQNKPTNDMKDNLHTDLYRKDERNMVTKISQRSQSHVTKFAKIAGSIAACTALVVSSVYFTSHYLFSNDGDNTLTVAATATPSPAADSNTSGTSSQFVPENLLGSYTSVNFCSTLSISGVTDNSFEFLIIVDHSFDLAYSSASASDDIDDSIKTIQGTASFEDGSSAVYKARDGITITFNYENGIITLDYTNAIDKDSSFTGTYIPTEATEDFDAAKAFATPVCLYQDKTYSYDLNNDGINETISYVNGIASINDVTFNFNDLFASPDLDSFTIVDIDDSDDTIELIFMDYGPSSDYAETIISYHKDGTYTTTEVGGTHISGLTFDNKGTITGSFRLSLLQTWFADCSWTFKDGKAVFNDEDYYTPYPVADMVTADIELCKSITLYSEDDLTSKTLTMQPQTVTFGQTDNKHWVKVIGNSDHTEGWLYLEDFDTIPSTNESASDYFLNLIQYD